MSHFFIFLLLFVFPPSPCVPVQTPTVATTGTKWSRLSFYFPSHSLSHHGLFGVHLLGGGRGHFLDDWGDIGWSVQLDLGEAILVGLHHTLDPCRMHTHTDTQIHTNRFLCCLFICLLVYLCICCTALTSPSQSSLVCKSVC